MKNKIYSAFISYNSLDEKEAVLIKKKIEKFRLPYKLHKENHIEKKLLPCYKSCENNEIDMQILEECEYLIVLCSENSILDSENIDEQVEKFREIRGYEFIIPVIINGEKDFLPQSLDKINYYNINLKDNGIFRIIAMLISIDSQTLADGQRNKILKNILIPSSVCLCALGICAFNIVNFYTPKTNYYIDYILKSGIPSGIYELSEEEFSLKNEHIAITTINKFEGYDIFNPYQEYVVNTENEDFSEIKIFPNEDNTRIIYCSKSGEVIKVENLSSDGTSTVQIQDYNAKSQDLAKQFAQYNGEDFSANNKLDAVTNQIDYNFTAHNFVETNNMFVDDIVKSYSCIYDENSVKIIFDNAKNSQGVYGFEYVLDEKGRVSKKYFLDKNKAKTSCIDGTYLIEYTYNENDLQEKIQYFEQNENYVKASENFVYDENLNLKEISYTDENNVLIISDKSYAKCEFIYEENRTINILFDENNVPLEFAMAYEYDENNMLKKTSYLNEKLENTLNDKFYSSEVYEYDENFNIVSIKYVDVNDEEVLNIFGNSEVKFTYDDKGNIITKTVYNGEKTHYNNGVSTIKFEYENQLLTRKIYLDENDEEIEIKKGYSSVSYEYDEENRVCHTSYFDKENKPTLCEDLYSSFKNIYDENNNLIEQSFYDEKLQAVNNIYDFSSIKGEYKNGLLKVVKLYDNEKNPVLSTEKYSQIEYSYDSYGRIIEMQFKDENGDFALNKNSWSDVTIHYGENGKASVIKFYDTGLQLVTSDFGYAYTEKEYDKNDNLIKESYYNNFDELSNNVLGFAYTEMKYDENDNCISVEYFDQNSIPVKNNLNGSSKIEMIYDNFGNVIEEICFDNDEFVKHIRNKYDKFSNKIEISNYTQDDNLLNNFEGYAVLKIEYDTKGNEALKSFFDQEQKPVFVESEMSASKKLSYDKFGKLIRVDLFDTNSALISPENGYASVEYEYDVSGNIITHKTYDDKNNLFCVKDGYAITRTVYDEKSNIIKLSYFDENDKLCLTTEGYAIKSLEYDEDKNITQTSYYGTDEKLKSCNDGYAILKQEYDDYQNNHIKSYYDAGETLIKKYIYNYDEDGNLFTDKNGVAKYEYLYQYGSFEMVIHKHYDTDGTAITDNKGVAMYYYYYENGVQKGKISCNFDGSVVV